jgi:hypothetical protein
MVMAGVDLQDFVNTLNKIMGEYGTSQSVRTMKMEDLNQAMDFMKAVLTDVAVNAEERNVEKYNILAKQDKVEGMTYDEWVEDKQKKQDEIKEGKKVASVVNTGEKVKKLVSLVNLQKERLRERLTELDAEYVGNESDPVYKEKRKEIDDILNLDATIMDEQGLKDLNNIINNIVNDGNHFAAGRLLSFWKDAHGTTAKLIAHKMRIRYAKLKSARTLSGLLAAMTWNTEDQAKLRDMLIADTATPAKAVARMFYGGNNIKEPIAKAVEKLLAKFKDNAHISINKVGVFQLLNQAMEVLPSITVMQSDSKLPAKVERSQEPVKTKEQSFKDILSNLIAGTKNRYEVGKANNANGKNIVANNHMEAALLTLDAMKQMGLINGYTIQGNEILVEENENASLDKLYDQLSGAEQELYSFIRDKFNDEKFKSQVRHTSESVHGILWDDIDNYAPRIAVPMSRESATAQKQIENIGNGDFSGTSTKKVGVRPSDRFMQRGQLANPKEYFYSTDSVNNFMTAYYESNYSIRGARALKAASYVFNSGDFKDFVNGVYNQSAYGYKDEFGIANNKSGKSQYNELLERFAKILTDTVSPPFLHKDTRSFSKKTADWVASGITSTVLKTSTQLVKQLLPNFGSGFSVYGGPASIKSVEVLTSIMHSKEHAEALSTFMDYFEGDFRSAMGEEILDELNRILNEPKGAYAVMLKASSFKDKYSPAKLGDIILKKSDRGAYAQSVIAAYIYHEVKAGRLKSAADFDIFDAAKNINRTAVAFALNSAEMLNNSSLAAERAPVTRVRENDELSFGGLFNSLFLKGFSLNAAMQAENNIRIATTRNPHVTAVEKRQAALRASTYILQVGIFNALKIAVISPSLTWAGGQVAELLMGITPDGETPEEEEKRKEENFKKFWWTYAADALIGWAPSPVEWTVKEGTNSAIDLINNFKDKNDKLKKPFYVDGLSMGTAGLMGSLGSSYVDALKTRKDKGLTNDTNAALDKLDFAKAAAITLGQGDALQLIYGMERSIKRSGAKHGTSRSSGSSWQSSWKGSWSK